MQKLTSAFKKAGEGPKSLMQFYRLKHAQVERKFSRGKIKKIEFIPLTEFYIAKIIPGLSLKPFDLIYKGLSSHDVQLFQTAIHGKPRMFLYIKKYKLSGVKEKGVREFKTLLEMKKRRIRTVTPFGVTKAGELLTYLAENSAPLTVIDFTASKVDARRSILSMIASTVQKMHSRNVLHRDLKLKNILINAEEPKLTLVDAERAFISIKPLTEMQKNKELSKVLYDSFLHQLIQRPADIEFFLKNYLGSEEKTMHWIQALKTLPEQPSLQSQHPWIQEIIRERGYLPDYAAFFQRLLGIKKLFT